VFLLGTNATISGTENRYEGREEALRDNDKRREKRKCFRIKVYNMLNTILCNTRVRRNFAAVLTVLSKFSDSAGKTIPHITIPLQRG